MTDDKKSGTVEKLDVIFTWAASLYLLIHIAGWLIRRKWGAILIVWSIWFFGAMLVLGGALTVITGNADLSDQTWPWLLFLVAAAVMTSVQWKMSQRNSGDREGGREQPLTTRAQIKAEATQLHRAGKPRTIQVY